MRAKDPVARGLMWLYDQIELHNGRWTAGWDTKIVGTIKRARQRPICVWVSREEVSQNSIRATMPDDSSPFTDSQPGRHHPIHPQ